MADNGTAASGPTVAWDDIGGVAYQRVKQVFGGDGVATEVSAASPLPTTQTGALPAGTNLIGRFTRSTDGLRTAVSINYNATAPPTTDALLTTLVLNKGATNSTAQTSIPVTSGKIMRLTHVIVGTRATVATLPYGLLTLRVNHSGAAVLASPAFFQVPVSGTAAVIGNTGTTAASIEDGFEMSGTMQLALSFSGNLATNVVSASILGYEYTA